MAEPLKLESPEALPATLAARLGQHRALFRRNEFLDNVLKHDDVLSVAEELDNFLLGQRIHAYHCTREPAEGFFLFRGLRLTDVLSHQAEFLQMFGSQFTADKVAEILKGN